MTTKALDALGVAITNAGYTWTPEMRNAYEKGIRENEWVEITKGECDELFRAASDHIEYAYAIEAKLKEKNT